MPEPHPGRPHFSVSLGLGVRRPHCWLRGRVRGTGITTSLAPQKLLVSPCVPTVELLLILNVLECWPLNI